MYTAGENSPMAHDYCIARLSWCTQWVKINPRLLHCKTCMVYTWVKIRARF